MWVSKKSWAEYWRGIEGSRGEGGGGGGSGDEYEKEGEAGGELIIQKITIGLHQILQTVTSLL